MRLTETDLIKSEEKERLQFKMYDSNFPFMFMLNAKRTNISGTCLVGDDAYDFTLTIVSETEKNFKERVKHRWRCFKRFVRHDLSSLKIRCAKQRCYTNLIKHIEKLKCVVNVNNKMWERSVYRYNRALGEAYVHIKIIDIRKISSKLW